MSRFAISAAALAALLTATLGAPAQADEYGAIAYSVDSGRHGWSYNYGSRAAAENRALNECGEASCKVVLWFRNACGALATGDDNGYGTGWAGTRRGAETNAMLNCRQVSDNCSVVRWACTNR